METVDCIIIGAGVVGLAIAERISRIFDDVIVLERHDAFGRESSSRNSEVIHAGLYYPADSFKTALGIRGNRYLYELCATNGIPHLNIGKIIISTDAAEEQSIENLYKQALENGVEQVRWLSRGELGNLEPEIRARTAFLSGTTGIIDSHALMRYFETGAQNNGAIVAYNCTFAGIDNDEHGYSIAVREGSGKASALHARMIINAAGISAPQIAAMGNIDIEKADYVVQPCKGEYFKISNRHRGKLNHLIYPAPTDISLGIHTVIDMSGALKLGPNAFFVDTIDYSVDETHIREFFESASTFLPFLISDDLSPDMAGIRAKRQVGKGFRDFIISEESENGLPGWINLIGIESPGLTASPAIAEYVFDLVKERCS